MKTWNIATLATAAALLGACGGVEGDEAFDEAWAEQESALPTVVTLAGRVVAMGEAQRGATVQAFNALGTRLGRATTTSTGTYSLPLPARPARVLVTAIHHAPKAITTTTLAVTSGRARLDVELGGWLGGDFTAENRTYLVTRSSTAPKLVRAVAWGMGGGLGSPWDEANDLLVGPRIAPLTTLVPANTKLVPDVEQGVVERTSARGTYLEARFSEELDTYNLGSSWQGLLFQQIVQTISHADGRGLPVRIRVRCKTCAGGYKDVKDGAIGATGPDNSYRPARAAPVPGFSDLAGQRYGDHVTMAKELGLLPPADAAATTFRPGAAASRAFMAELLVRALALPLANPATPRYSDVPRTHVSYRAIETAAARGVLTSTTTRFNPSGTFTRAELGGFVTNAARWPAYAPSAPTFTDVARTYWAFSRIETAHGYCRAVEPRGAYDVTDYAPTAAATRAEAVAAAVRMMNCFLGTEIGAR